MSRDGPVFAWMPPSLYTCASYNPQRIRGPRYLE